MNKLNNKAILNDRVLRMKFIMANANQLSNRGALEFGGNKKQYMSEALKEIWKDVKECFNNEGLKILRYTKIDSTTSYTIVSSYELKMGKNGEYVRAKSIKGIRSYKNAVLMDFTVENMVKLHKAGYNLSE